MREKLNAWQRAVVSAVTRGVPVNESDLHRITAHYTVGLLEVAKFLKAFYTRLDEIIKEMPDEAKADEARSNEG